MITQFTNTCHSTAPFGIFAGRFASITSGPAIRDAAICDTAIATADFQKSARPESAAATYGPVGQFRPVADVFTRPVAAHEMTTPVANFWKQLTGGNRLPALEPLPLT